jgi:hypothetical protein
MLRCSQHDYEIYKRIAARCMFNEIECTQNIQLKRATAYFGGIYVATQISHDNSFFEEDACTQTEHTNR